MVIIQVYNEKQLVLKEDITILNVYTPNKRASKYMLHGKNCYVAKTDQKFKKIYRFTTVIKDAKRWAG